MGKYSIAVGKDSFLETTARVDLSGITVKPANKSKMFQKWEYYSGHLFEMQV